MTLREHIDAILAQKKAMKSQKQVEKKLHLFWPTIYGIWFSQFPEQAALSLPLPSDPEPRALTPNEKQKLGNAIENRKNQIQTWYRNQRFKIGKADTQGKHRAGPLDTVLAALLDSQQPQAHKRARHAIQVEASEEEKAAVAAQVIAENEEMREQESRGEPEAAPEERNLAQLQDGIDALDNVFTKVHKAAHQATKWVGMTVVGGPNPRLGGELSMKIICHGETLEGNDFEDSCVNFDKHIVEAFEGFLRQVFSVSECCTAALDTTTPAGDDDKEQRPVTLIPPPVPEPVAEPTPPKKKSKSKKKKDAVSKHRGRCVSYHARRCSYLRIRYHPPWNVVIDPALDLDIPSTPVFAPTLSSPPPPLNLWPAGMGPPLSPTAAGVSAMQERGLNPAGPTTGPTMALDPALDLDISSAPAFAPTPSPLFAVQERGASMAEPTMAKAIDSELDLDVPFHPAKTLLFEAFRQPAPPVFSLPRLPSFTPARPTPRPLRRPGSAAQTLTQMIANGKVPHVSVDPKPIANPAPVVTAPCASVAPVVPAPHVPVDPQPIANPEPVNPAPARRRGRPAKAAPVALADATSIQGGEAAAAEVKAAERKAAAETLAAQRAKGWIHGPDGSVVLLRTRKPARNPDGSLDETEKAMLERADIVRAENESLKKKGKRKAPASSAAPTVTPHHGVEVYNRLPLLNQLALLLNQLQLTWRCSTSPAKGLSPP
ncbi:hypothetical protein B0H14DRAFT_2582509 [Mycena olivaceomarginata]|nr:hypothetical protein B0H14DRAFT_2582509 [Mycena olivaceomarginata]